PEPNPPNFARISRLYTRGGLGLWKSRVDWDILPPKEGGVLMKVFPWMQKFVSCVVSFAVFAQAQSPPKSHPASFAVSVAVLNSAVDNTHCETGKELHARVISPLRIGDKDAPSESFLRGNYVFCNRDARGRLRIAGIKFSAL